MKTLKLLFTAILMLAFATPTQAQFWKKLKKKAEEKISKAEDKLIDKLDKKTDETLEGKKKSKTKIIQSKELPKLNGGSGILKINDNGYEYITKDIAVSVYGKFTKENLSSSVKTYNQDRLIKPVDAYPEGYALAFNGGGFLNPKEGKIVIHHADKSKVVFSLKGTWNTVNGNQPIEGSFISFNVSEIIDQRTQNNSQESNSSNSNANSSSTTNSTEISFNSTKNTDIIPNKFTFSSSLEVKMTSNDGSSAEIEFLLGDYSDIFAMSIASKEMGQGGKVYNVITPKNITMFVDVAGMKMKKTVPQEQFSQANFGDKVPANSADLKKTGATKSILGYLCREYRYVNDGGYVSVWATKDFPAKSKNITMLGMRENGPIEGFVLEIDIKSKNESGNMKAVKFNKNKSITINTTEYKSMGF